MPLNNSHGSEVPGGNTNRASGFRLKNLAANTFGGIYRSSWQSQYSPVPIEKSARPWRVMRIISNLKGRGLIRAELDLPDPLCGFSPSFGLPEGQVVIAGNRRFVPAARATPFGDTPCDSHPAGPVHEGVRHGCLQSWNSFCEFKTARTSIL